MGAHSPLSGSSLNESWDVLLLTIVFFRGAKVFSWMQKFCSSFFQVQRAGSSNGNTSSSTNNRKAVQTNWKVKSGKGGSKSSKLPENRSCTNNIQKQKQQRWQWKRPEGGGFQTQRGYEKMKMKNDLFFSKKKIIAKPTNKSLALSFLFFPPLEQYFLSIIFVLLHFCDVCGIFVNIFHFVSTQKTSVSPQMPLCAKKFFWCATHKVFVSQNKHHFRGMLHPRKSILHTQEVAPTKDTEQKHGKHGSGALLSSFPSAPCCGAR